ncbi:MAG TPA: glucodextranase DOMON-like domain-containing protein, partial [Candidatus Krumholzibacterium sp.]|nr:glucodextranase DOMON-like domain-containing protein [Candidatus Krumholzibacterium sp.]
ADVVGFGETLGISLQLIDAFGNEVREAGRTVTLQREPASSGVLTDPSVVLDENGYGESGFTAGSERAVVRISASSPPLEGGEIAFEIDNITTISDPAFPEPDLGHSPLEAMDLTTVLVSNTAEYIDLRIRFDSNFDGAHLVILMETGSDEAGATADPFLFPVTYGHALRPDYALTYKYSSDDYGDMRRWSGTEWEWWDDEGDQYISTSSGTWVPGIDIHSKWITRADGYVNYRIPFEFFEGSIPSTIRLEVYLTQEAAEGLKRSAFDSAPHDSTLDLDFDPADPEADWTLAEVPVTLRNWSDPYVVVSDFPVPPVMTSPLATPSTIDAGGMVRFTVALADAGDGIGTVLIDLSPLGGSRYQFLGDDGTGGDLTAGDGIYSYLYIVPPDIAGGMYELSVSARDDRNISRSTTTIELEVVGTIEPIRVITDEVDDDHGPDQFGREGLYYLYPTNVVFGQNAFDLEEMIIFETSNVVGGEIIPSFAFQVKIGNLADPADEGTADWNPLYADINIQKVDIYIDAFKGGATEGLPNRQNDFKRWDAWDYAIVMEGWYKGVITSNNQNTPIAWAGGVRKSDRDIVLLTDFEANTMTAVVSKA